MSAFAAPADGARSPGEATLWSLGATLAPLAGGVALVAAADEGALLVTGQVLTFGGLVLGPAAGYWYGDRAPRGWQGVVVRGIAIGAAFGVTAGSEGGLGPELETAALVVMVATGAAAWDIAFVGRHVRARNREAGFDAALMPYRDASGAPGVAVTVRF